METFLVHGMGGGEGEHAGGAPLGSTAALYKFGVIAFGNLS